MGPAARKRLKWICAIGTILIIVALAFRFYHYFQSEESIFRHVPKTTKLEPATVVVMVLDLSLPKDPDERGQFLWDKFSKHPAEKGLSAYSSDDWHHDFDLLSDALVQKAAALKLDSDSLRKALSFVREDTHPDVVILPEAAYQVTFEGRLVWMITMKWENNGGSLIHIRGYALDQKTLENLGFMTCG